MRQIVTHAVRLASLISIAESSDQGGPHAPEGLRESSSFKRRYLMVDSANRLVAAGIENNLEKTKRTLQPWSERTAAPATSLPNLPKKT